MSVAHVIVAARIRTASEVPVAERPSSPLSTGGAGVIFEYEVAAILMSRLVRGASVPVGMRTPVARVAFQQGNEGYPLDDIVARGHADPPAVAPSIQAAPGGLTASHDHMAVVRHGAWEARNEALL
jgi:hypothetical protein